MKLYSFVSLPLRLDDYQENWDANANVQAPADVKYHHASEGSQPGYSFKFASLVNGHDLPHFHEHRYEGYDDYRRQAALF